MVVVIVELYMMIFLGLMSLSAARGDFLAYQRFFALWNGDGALSRGWPFEIMKTNLLLVVYLWAMCRTLHPRHEAVQRLGLVGAAVLLVLLQLVWARSYVLTQPSFQLIRLPM